MQKQVFLVLGGGLLGALMVAWVRPATDAGATVLVVFALLLAQAVSALAGWLARARRPGGGPPSGAVALALVALAASEAGARDASFELVNPSADTVVQVYAVPSGSAAWGTDRLGDTVLAPQGRVRIALSGCAVDVRAVYGDGREVVRRGFDGCRSQQLVLERQAASDGPAGGGMPATDAGRNPPAMASALPPRAMDLQSLRGFFANPDDAPARGAGRPMMLMAAPRRLTPARVFLPPEGIPPPGVGAYGIMALRAQPTDANAARLTMACQAFLASLPTQASLPSSIAVADQMLTIWPLLAAGAAEAERGSCKPMLQHYALVAGQAAIADAEIVAGPLRGAGPFLIGWSPSNKRGVPDAVVLVVDMSGLNSQERFDDAFRFWQEKVIGDPELWRNGFDPERLRLSVKDFVDRYGAAIQGAIKLWGG